MYFLLKQARWLQGAAVDVLLKLFPNNVCLFVYLSYHTHVSKIVYAASMRNEGCTEPVLTVQVGGLFMEA